MFPRVLACHAPACIDGLSCLFTGASPFLSAAYFVKFPGVLNVPYLFTEVGMLCAGLHLRIAVPLRKCVPWVSYFMGEFTQ